MIHFDVSTGGVPEIAVGCAERQYPMVISPSSMRVFDARSKRGPCLVSDDVCAIESNWQLH
jgi:hypothetical protein